MTNLTVLHSTSRPMVEIRKLQESLEETDRTFVVAAITKLRKSGWAFSHGSKAEDLIDEYVRVLAPKGRGPIGRVLTMLLEGRHDSCTTGYLPIPAAFARLCDEEHSAIRSKIRDAKQADRRRLALWNRLPDSWNNRQREEHIDSVLAELDGIETGERHERLR